MGNIWTSISIFTFSPCDEYSIRMQLYATDASSSLPSICEHEEILSRNLTVRNHLSISFSETLDYNITKDQPSSIMMSHWFYQDVSYRYVCSYDIESKRLPWDGMFMLTQTIPPVTMTN